VLPVGPAKYRITHRGGTGADVVRRGGLTRVLTLPVEVVELEPGEAEATAEPVALDAVEEVDEVDAVDAEDGVDEGSPRPGPGRQGELF
jgi:hypothetical protein